MGYSRKNPHLPANGHNFRTPLPPGFPEALDPGTTGFPREKTPSCLDFQKRL